ncbi:AAA family ATPase [Candidatus Mycolicibacterium alkanivorans]|uniref:AAA family ATPase n=1 Tax=Candidatus Mycolicibacterium alkanivorans TaxID=2954114 RepID=A0ABS9YUW1_9MYCO|nr:AAA family ATPase [Candidatus Mycolicibacterium alkanivorans]MCI4674970.1 AAA family ATPase [Candidatus Mycolicibacterium alkanivorans]
MKLHRLVLTNYRGITHREIEFPDHGVVVVCGANEIGKTSMIEALDLLLESKDRSTKKDVKQVKPTHADVGSEVTAEISTGPYRFVYSKCFHKKFKTELTILEPRREQLTGDEAHDRVRAMLDETMDTELWQAQRVLQAGSTAAVSLSGCDALSRALDKVAGDAADTPDGSGTDSLLIDRIDGEYGRYFTATGRPTGGWSTAINQLKAATDEVARCTAAVAEVDERVARHAELAERLTGLSDQRHAVTQRCQAAECSAAALAELRKQLDNAILVATAATGTSSASAAAQAERSRLCADVEARRARIAELDTEVAAALDAETTAREVAEIASATAAGSTAGLVEAEDALATAQRVVAGLAGREQADRLAAQLARIDAAQEQLGEIEAQVAGIALTSEVMADIESAAALVERFETQLASTATTVEFTATADLELTVGGEVVRLAAGERWTPPVSAATTVELPGLVSIHVDPGAATAGIQDKLIAAQGVVTEALRQGGATDLDNARDLDRRRRELISSRDQASATATALLGGDDVEQLRVRLATLREAIDPELAAAGVDHDTAHAGLAAAQQAVATVKAQAGTDARVAVEADAQLAKKSTHTTVLTEKAADARAELVTLQDRLAALRAEAGDDEVAARAAADAEAARLADAAVAELTTRYAAADPAAVEAEQTAAMAAAAALHREISEVERALNDLTVELGVIGSEGRQSSLDAAQTALRHAEAEYERVSRRARAAELLRSVMARHRDNTRQRYVEPFRAEIERLGRRVFGPTFEVEVDSDLRICNRTLDGCTVPYESLSGGAKEQLGILARLAGAALVSKEDTVPVVIDDALGFTDPERLTKMGAVFDNVGSHGQVIVLTCMPTRYVGVENAHVIELTA